MRTKPHMLCIVATLVACLAFMGLQTRPAFAKQNHQAASIAFASAQASNENPQESSSPTEQPNKLFGLPWNHLPFVTGESSDLEHDLAVRIAISEPKELIEKFDPPVTYQGRHFSTATVTGASINASKVVTITLPSEVLNRPDDEVERLLSSIDAKRAELGLSACTSNTVGEYCASHAAYCTAILNLAIIQSCLDYARDHYENKTLYRIVLPSGTYELGAPALNECLHIYSNTWIDMTSNTKLVHKSRKTCLLRNSKAEDALSGYEDHDIILDGGTWVGLNSPTSSHDEVALCHAKDIVVRNAVFDGCSGAHHLELVGVSNASISGCEFKGYTGTTTKEAIQIDIAGAASASTFRKSDYTTTRNVVISNNSFHDLSRGIGTHYAYIGYLNSEILIQNNMFNHLEHEAIMLVSFKNTAIVGNRILNCPQAIHVLPALNSTSRYSKTGKPYATCQNYLIEGNVISTARNADKIWGAITIYGNKVGSTTYALKNVILKNNVVNASNVALTLSRTSGITATGETYISEDSYSTLVHKAAQASFSHSSFKCMNGSGISAQSECNLVLNRCKANACKTSGITAQDATLTATSCSFASNGHSGLLATNCVISLKSSTFSKNKRYGIYASKSKLSTSKGSAKSNGKDGMRLADGTATVTRFKTHKNKQCGIRSIGCTVQISKSACVKNRAHGSSLLRSKATIRSCAFKQNKKNGLLIGDKTTLKNLKGSKFTRNKRYGVYGCGKSRVSKQSRNKYLENGKGGYHVPMVKKKKRMRPSGIRVAKDSAK